MAFDDLKSGKVDNALVGGTHISFSPHQTAEFKKLQVLAPDANSRSYSANRTGYFKSEAVVAILLQNRNNGRRVYASVIGASTNSDD